MIEQIALTRFRSVLRRSLRLAPLTLFVGPNGSGKSSVIRAIEVASTSAAAKAQREGSSRRPPPRTGRIVPSPVGVQEIYAYTDRASSEISVRTGVGESFTLSLKPSGERIAAQYAVEGNVRSTFDALFHVRLLDSTRLALGLSAEPWRLASLSKLKSQLMMISRSPEKNVIYRDIGKRLFGLDWEARIDGEDVLYLVDSSIGPAGVLVPFHQASLGARQFFPVVVESLTSAPGTALVVEEPELSLHPAAQVDAGIFFVATVARGMQVIASTHSPYVLLGICQQVRDGVLPSRHVAVFNFKKGQYGTSVRRIKMNDNGQLLGWIPSFSEVDERLMRDWRGSLEHSDEDAET